MNYSKISPVIKSSFPLNHTRIISMDLSILESGLGQCDSLRQFNQILSQVIFTGFIKDIYAASRVVKFSTDISFIELLYSRRIFDHIENSNCFTWNTMMRSYLKKNCTKMVVSLYKSMLENVVVPDTYTHPILIQAVAQMPSEVEGKAVHGHVLRMGFSSDVYVQNTLINMYIVCGDIRLAEMVFEQSHVLDSISWNSILAGYIQVGNVRKAKLVFSQMPDRNIIASNSMIVLFGRAGEVDEAACLFDKMPEKDVISWSALVSCYEQNQMYADALSVFVKMRSNGVQVDEIALVSMISVCANLCNVNVGKSTHNLALKIGIESYINLQNALIHMYVNCGEVSSAQKLFEGSYYLDQISWNSMISGYSKSGLVEKAEQLFDSMPMRDTISWSAMISGYVQSEQFSKALSLFQMMQVEEVRPDETTLVSVISACTHLAALEQGKWVHTYIRRNNVRVNPMLGTTLIDMYMKSGCVENAMGVFNDMGERGVSSWNAVISGLSLNGKVECSLEVFAEMKMSGEIPNGITFMGVIGACRHMGLVDEGRTHFNSMIYEHKIKPDVKHYGCMVDLFGRAGLLKEAEEIIGSMPMEPDIATWGALLGACRKHGNNEMGERIARKLVQVSPYHDGFNILLSNIYASKGNWEHVLEVRGMMVEQGVLKTPGCSMIEVGGVAHEFLAGGRRHPRMDDIEKMLSLMCRKLKLEGYNPEMSEVSLEIDDEEKEIALSRHSERLAIAFGLIATDPPMPIRVMKNLRICNDCHTVVKIISKAFGREIIVRDRQRFHHFKNGGCSCMDYW